MSGFNIIPKETKETKDAVYSRDRSMYMQGEDDALGELPRDNSVQSRDRHCYDMGYSSGVYKNTRRR